MRYAIIGFTGDTSQATDEKIAEVRSELEKRGAEVFGVGWDRHAGIDAFVVRFVINAESDAEAERSAKQTIDDLLGPGHGWGVSKIQPVREGMGPNPFDH